MAAFRQTPVALLVLATVLCVASYAEAQILFSKLPKSLIVTATMPGGGPITGNLNLHLTFFQLFSQSWGDLSGTFDLHYFRQLQ